MDGLSSAAIVVLFDGLDRAARIVERLLRLARSEPGAQPARLEPLDLCEVVRQAVADTIALSRGRLIRQAVPLA